MSAQPTMRATARPRPPVWDGPRRWAVLAGVVSGVLDNFAPNVAQLEVMDKTCRGKISWGVTPGTTSLRFDRGVVQSARACRQKAAGRCGSPHPLHAIAERSAHDMNLLANGS